VAVVQAFFNLSEELEHPVIVHLELTAGGSIGVDLHGDEEGYIGDSWLTRSCSWRRRSSVRRRLGNATPMQ
jgi:hypothetical protein